jgi:hypothetical protein
MNTRARKVSATIAGMALAVAGLSACETDDPGTTDPNGGTDPTSVTDTSVPAGPTSTAMVDPTTTIAG